MKKIGILTFHASHNNGSMLQALALQTILEEKYKCKVEIINFSNLNQQNMYAILPKADNFKRKIKNLIWLTNYKQLKKQYNSYCEFSDKYFHLSKEFCQNHEDLKKIANNYDAIIVGSDQVWNIACRDADDAYYLDFTEDIPKYTYAVSFGANNPFKLDNGSDIHKNYSEKFKKISVREKNAQKWIKEATDRDVPICLDPTMLFNENEWNNIVDIGDRIIKEKYIYYYCFSITPKVQKFLKWLSKEKNMPVYFMEAKEYTLKACWKNGIKLIGKYGPDVYMNVVKNSELFVTTSFHGTAFATIYNKNFWYIDSGHNDPSKDDRAISFLSQLGLMDRYKTIEELKKINLETTINYSEVEKKLDILRKESKNYIESVVEDI